MSGIDSSGFTPKTEEEIQDDLISGFRAVFGAFITVIAQSVFGQLIGIIADRLADLWQLGLALYNGSTREGAVGVQLDNIGALTGTVRKQATYTKVAIQCIGVDGTVIPIGSVVSNPDTGVQFTNDLAGTISGGVVSILFRALDPGAVPGFAGTLTQIETPVAGWSSATNPLDQSTLGTELETDAAFRVRQVQELRAQGASTVAAIRAKIQELTGVSGCFVFENTSDVTDVNGLPPHSFECVVSGGDTNAIAQSIADNKPVGIATYGSSSVAATDANGFAVTINLSRPTQLNAYVIVNQKADASLYPLNGDDLVKEAIAALQPVFGIGVDLRSSALMPAYVPNPALPTSTGVSGVLESDPPLIGTAPSPGTSTTIPVGNRQQIALDTSRIIVNTILIAP